MSRHINKIIIHCAATKPTMDVGVKEIRQWHTTPKPKGNGWTDVGYHFVIRRDGVVETGRPLQQSGAHTTGQNKNSIGVCLVGGLAADGKTPESNFTDSQWNALEECVRGLSAKYPSATVHGHNEFAAKACPCFDVKAWWAGIVGTK